jgi:hypothetical protein
VSETTGTEGIGEPEARDAEREDPSVAGRPEVPAFGDEGAAKTGEETRRLEEREQRQHATQQHGDTFAIESDEPSDASVRHGASNRVTALPGDEPDGDTDS